MTVSDRERRQWFLSLMALPLLIAAVFALHSWRNAQEYAARTEFRVRPNDADQPYAGAQWKLSSTRLIGDGKDTTMTLPGGMRLVIVRLAARPTQAIGDDWLQCSLTLTDDAGRRWRPLDFILSRDISRDLEPDKQPIEGCNTASAHPPGKGRDVVIEEKFLVPEAALNSLKAQLSFRPSRPEALSFPLTFDR